MDHVYRIYTEDVDRQAVIPVTSEAFENFTLHETIGYYRGEREDSIVLEIVDAEETDVQSLAEKIRKLTGQKSVLIMCLSGRAKRI